MSPFFQEPVMGNSIAMPLITILSGVAEGGNGGMCPPPPLVLKVKKVPFSWTEMPHLKNEKSIS